MSTIPMYHANTTVASCKVIGRHRSAAKRSHAHLATLSLIAILQGASGCTSAQVTDLLGGGRFSAFDESFFRLRIVNESGLDATVHAVYYLGSREVRRTDRHLAAEGFDQTDLIVPTQVDRIVVSADAEWAGAGGSVHTVALATAAIDTADAFASDGVIEWIIPVFVFDDCNDNGTPDELDVESGESDDRNEDGVPDECEDANAQIQRS